MESTHSEKEMQTRAPSDRSMVTASEAVIPEMPPPDEKRDLESQEVSGAKVQKVQTNRTLVFIGLVLALFLAALDSTIVSTSLTQIGSGFNQMAIVSWVATAYLLTFNAFQPLFSKFSDIFGCKWVLLFGITVFLIGSMLCGAAQSITMLIVARTFAGIGGAGIVSMVFVIIADLVPLEKRGIYQAAINGVFSFSSIFGPLIGGSITDYVTWRWNFYLNLPIGAAAIIVLLFFLRMPAPKGKFADKLKRIDYAGTTIVLVFATLFLLAMNFGGQTFPWKSAAVIVPLALTVPLVGLLMLVESKFAREPLMPGRLFKNHSVACILVTGWFFGLTNYSLIYYLPIYFQVVRADSAMWSGIRLIPLQVTSCTIGALAGIFISKTGLFRPLISSGMGLLTLYVGLISMFDMNTSWSTVYGFTVIGGLGLGQLFSSFILGLQACAERRDTAVVTGLGNFLFDLGGALGVAISSAILNSSLEQNLPGVVPAQNVETIISSGEFIRHGLPAEYLDGALEVYVKAFRLVWHVMIAMAGTGFLASLFIKNETVRKAAGNAAMLGKEKNNVEMLPEAAMEEEVEVAGQHNTETKISEKIDIVTETETDKATAATEGNKNAVEPSATAL